MWLLYKINRVCPRTRMLLPRQLRHLAGADILKGMFTLADMTVNRYMLHSADVESDVCVKVVMFGILAFGFVSLCWQVHLATGFVCVYWRFKWLHAGVNRSMLMPWVVGVVIGAALLALGFRFSLHAPLHVLGSIRADKVEAELELVLFFTTLLVYSFAALRMLPGRHQATVLGMAWLYPLNFVATLGPQTLSCFYGRRMHKLSFACISLNGVGNAVAFALLHHDLRRAGARCDHGRAEGWEGISSFPVTFCANLVHEHWIPSVQRDALARSELQTAALWNAKEVTVSEIEETASIVEMDARLADGSLQAADAL
eukprot:CAMPEP_0194531638 /NCGR_PEP_ID=MMETSP0253-20130528/68994_1 /TAXON_ID=2966 /ORGANISM="Noctiluca scintillans" /LENGTH=313 /DNA_ID=CAMNT_0039377007 /DNA_START=38 /DNA_END=979 /DNA_ORIENTATION=-